MLYYVEFTTSNKGTFAATFVDTNEFPIYEFGSDLVDVVRSRAMKEVSPNTTDLTVHIYEVYPTGQIIRSWMVWWQGGCWANGIPGKWMSIELEKDEWEMFLVH